DPAYNIVTIRSCYSFRVARLNPYTPGAGTRPPVLAGRDTQLALITNIADLVEAGRQTTPLICTGLRGMGKTAVLFAARELLRERHWLAGYYEVRRDVEPGTAVASIAVEGVLTVRKGLRRALGAAVARVGSAKVSFGPATLEITAKGTPSDTDPYPELVEFLRLIGNAAKDDRSGVALLVDELQVFRKRDLAVLIQALSFLRDEPIVLVGAGLPYLPSEMSKANTYAERFRYETIDRLHDSEVRRAVTEPAAAEGVTWTTDAVDQVVTLSFGYPYFVQLYASETWVAANNTDTITVDHVHAAIDPVQRQLDAGLYAARYDRLSDTERDYIHAMVRCIETIEGKQQLEFNLGTERVGSGAVAGDIVKSCG